MALQGNDPGALRHTATGLRYSGAALIGVATLYQSLAENAKARAAALGNAPPGSQSAQVRNDTMTEAARLAAKAKNFQQLAGSMITAAGALEGTATRQDAASSPAGFMPPSLDLSGPLAPTPFDPPTGGDATVDPPSGGGPTGGGGPSPGGGVRGLPGDDPLTGGVTPSGAPPGFGAIGGAGAGDLPAGQDPTAENASTAVADGQEAKREETGAGPLGLIRGGGAAAGIAVAGVVGAGIAASVLRASRRAAKRRNDLWEDEERDGDDVEAVYQAGPGKPPAAG